jgi:hypothetical protein
MFVSALPHTDVLERVVRQASMSSQCLWVAHYARLALANMASSFEFDLCVCEAEVPASTPLTFVGLWDRRGALSVAFACLAPDEGACDHTVVGNFLATLSASLSSGQPFMFALTLDAFLPRLARSWSWSDADIYPCVERRLPDQALDAWPVDPVSTVDAAGRRVRVGVLTPTDAPVVWAHWPYRAERPVSAIALLLQHLHSAAVFVDDEPGTFNVQATPP